MPVWKMGEKKSCGVVETPSDTCPLTEPAYYPVGGFDFTLILNFILGGAEAAEELPAEGLEGVGCEPLDGSDVRAPPDGRGLRSTLLLLPLPPLKLLPPPPPPLPLPPPPLPLPPPLPGRGFRAGLDPPLLLERCNTGGVADFLVGKSPGDDIEGLGEKGRGDCECAGEPTMMEPDRSLLGLTPLGVARIDPASDEWAAGFLILSLSHRLKGTLTTLVRFLNTLGGNPLTLSLTSFLGRGLSVTSELGRFRFLADGGARLEERLSPLVLILGGTDGLE